MRIPLGDKSIEIIQGDIVNQEVDAIVNAANEHLMRGSGVCGAIFNAAGRELEDRCKDALDARGMQTVPVGQAVITYGSGRLSAKYVIHAVGPIYMQHSPGKAADLLSATYWNSMEVAASVGAKSIAFPNISTGVYGYPIPEAAEVAFDAVSLYLSSQKSSLEIAQFVIFDEANKAAYDNLVKNRFKGGE